MEQSGIIQKVSKPTDWVHPMLLVTKKGGGLRICLDPRKMNVAINREYVQIPTTETLLPKLSGATVFTVLDAASAFHQLKLDEQSADLCTFATPKGRYRFMRLPFGLKSAPEVFQNRMNQVLEGLDGVLCYFDDILVYGTTMVEHNTRLENVLKRARQMNLKLDRAKMQLAQRRVKYLGHQLGVQGTRVTHERTQAIQELQAPKCKADLQRFLGMVGFLTRFIPNLSSITTYLRQLVKYDVKWIWDEQAISEFNKVKRAVANAAELNYFNPKDEITLTVDASKDGMGAALLQSKGPVAYASSTFTTAQKNYSMIEKELLAILFGCERFHFYIYGFPITILTDHKPLVNLVHKPLEKISPRLQRMTARLQRYNTTIKYVPGKTQYISDTLSRASSSELSDTHYLNDNSLTVHLLAIASQARIERLKAATAQDKELLKIIQYCCEGWPRYIAHVEPFVKKYWTYRDELHVSEGLVFRGEQIIIPLLERLHVLKTLHDTHEGIVSCKNKARKGLYWPGISVDIEKFVNSCKVCLMKSKMPKHEMLLPHHIPSLPWQKIALDFMELQGNHYIIVVDYLSKFTLVEELKSKTAEQIVKYLKGICAIHGIPQYIMSDNGPPFDSYMYNKFLELWGIEKVTSSPNFPQSNGMIERTVQTVKARLTKTLLDGKDYHLVALNINSTAHNGLESPAEIIMGRRLRTLLTISGTELLPKYDLSETYDRLRLNQDNMLSTSKIIADKNLTKLKIGESVYYRHSSDSWKPAVIVENDTSPRSYKVKSTTGGYYRRNRRHLKPVGSPIQINNGIIDNSETMNGPTKANMADVPLKSPVQADVYNKPVSVTQGKPDLASDNGEGHRSSLPVQSIPGASLPVQSIPGASQQTESKFCKQIPAKDLIVTVPKINPQTRSGRSINKPAWLQDYTVP